MTMQAAKPKGRVAQTATKALLMAAAGLSLAACSTNRTPTGWDYPRDFRERHPVVLTDGQRTLDVFVSGALEGLDRRQRTDVRVFASDYRRSGKGPMMAVVPKGTQDDAAAQRTLSQIRHAISEAGLPGGSLSVSTYYPKDPSLASPIRLSFVSLQAKVATKCGLWPQDLGISDWPEMMRNRPYWNHGCATQSNVAAQIDDPLDLVRGRAEGRGDTQKRTRAIEQLRQGKDPSTEYRQSGPVINQSVGGQQ